jgi:septal ring-binding cell division protein DamX
MISGTEGSSNLFVLPTSVQGRACYRVIWGLFDSREAAERSKGSLPMSLQAGDAAAVALSRFLR